MQTHLFWRLLGSFCSGFGVTHDGRMGRSTATKLKGDERRRVQDGEEAAGRRTGARMRELGIRGNESSDE